MMRLLAGVLLLAALAALLLTRAEPFGPTATIVEPTAAVGRATPLTVTARDRGTGLARLEVRLVPEGGTPVVLATERYPPRSVGWPWAAGEETLAVTLNAATAGVPEGRATLSTWATDHSWLAPLRRGPRLVRAITVDLTPPVLEVLTSQHHGRVGGAEFAVYRVGADAAMSGILVGDLVFPGIPGLFADGALRAALFALPHDLPDVRPAAVAVDAAGNRRTAALDIAVRPQRFAEKTLPITDEFLTRKVPELLQANGLDPSGDLVTGYLRINRELRTATEERVRALCRESAPTVLWQGEFLRLPNSAPLSGFADRRTYQHQGQVIDRQTHLGYDLASLRTSPVPAANAGRVALAGPLGIYGNTVIVDHGLGLFSLYGHLSTIHVAAGQPVARGEVLGKTGETGLAVGDHLHFSVMIRGVHVDPREWWDGHWIHDHVEARLAAYPRAGTAQ